MQVSPTSARGAVYSDTEEAPEEVPRSPRTHLLGRSVPAGEDWGRLIKQMPSVEEMRKEVADITCQMQSIYVADPRLGHEEANSAGDRQKPIINTSDTSETSVSPTADVDSRPEGNCRSFKLEKTLWTTCLEGNDIKTYPPQCRVSSSAPHVEQISEEFVINGKRYRQTYEKKVVLERRTTRDVFLLPASSGEPKLIPMPETSVEYASPNFQQMSSIPTEEVADECYLPKLTSPTEIDPGECPRYEVTMERGNPTDVRLAKKDGLVSPGVKRLPFNNEKNSTNSKCQDDASQINSNKTPTHAGDGNLSSEKPSKTRLNKTVVRGLTDSIRKHMVMNLRRSQSVGRSGLERLVKRKTRVEWEMGDESVPRSPASEANGNVESSKSSQAMAGYMYKFGVWDQKAPVLDPRLPLVVRTSVFSSSAEHPPSGAVVATPPEWHHAEMRLDSLANGAGQASMQQVQQPEQQPMLRGRVVACLQRFTQQSEASGRPLHRSTYVQQTRLVRQRNKDGDCDPVETIKFASDGTRGNIAQLLFATPENHLGVKGEEKPIESIETTFQYCSNERIQLLHDICPRAAAATVLLGRQSRKKKHETDPGSSMDDSDFRMNGSCTGTNMVPEGNGDNHCDRIGSPLVLVGATSWCPASLLVHDLSRYLVFNKKQSGQITNEEPGCSNSGSPQEKRSKSSSSYELSIRGGTLDGLLLYALRLLSLEGSDDHLDMLFPHVFRVTYQLFTTHETLIDKLIHLYVALSPIEPGCQRTDWLEALKAAQFLVEIVQQLPFDEMTRRLIVRLTRFAQLLDLDGREGGRGSATNGQLSALSAESEHSVLANRLLEKLPPLFAIAGIRKRVSDVDQSYPQLKEPIKPAGTASKQTRQSDKVEDVHTEIGAFGELSWVSDDRFNAAIQRTQSLLKLTPESIALEITRIEEEYFKQIDFREFFNTRRLERGEAKTLSLCVKHFNRLNKWARSQLFIFSPHISEEASNCVTGQKSNFSGHRAQTACTAVKGSTKSGSIKPIRLRKINSLNNMFTHLCEVLKHLRIMKNFSSLLAILPALNEVPPFALTRKSKGLIAAFANYMMPPKFTDYRRELEAAALPYLPYLGLTFQQLIHLHAGNAILLPTEPGSHEQCNNHESENVEIFSNKSGTTALAGVMALSPTVKSEEFINVWFCFKQYLILSCFIKCQENESISRYNISCNKAVFEVLNNFNDCFSDNDLNKGMRALLSKNKSKRTDSNPQHS